MNTLQDKWETFAGVVIPRGACETQHRAMKQAFYAGAIEMFNLTSEVTEKYSVEAVQAIIQNVLAEISAFGEMVQRGEA